MAANLHNLHDSKGVGVGSEMTNQLLTNHRECNCEAEVATSISATNGGPGAAYSLPTITLTEHNTGSANEQINEVRLLSTCWAISG